MATINAINNITPTLYGSSIANGDITIEGTSNATKTTSYVLLQPSGGKVGIGISTPSNILHVKGSSGQIRIDDGTVTADFGCSSSLGYVGTITNHSFYIYANDTEYIRITGAGVTTFKGEAVFSKDGSNIKITRTSQTDRFVGIDQYDYLLLTNYADVTKGFKIDNAGGGYISNGMYVAGDGGAGTGYFGLTNVVNETVSSGTGTIKLCGATSRNSTGFWKVYNSNVGTRYIPYFTTITG